MIPPQQYKIGLQVVYDDSFWVQVQEALERSARPLPIELVPIENYYDDSVSSADYDGLIEAVFAQDLDALVCYALPDAVIYGLLDQGLPIVRLLESAVHHPLYTSPVGWYDCGHMAGDYLAAQLDGPGAVLVAGNRADAESRVAGLRDALHARPDLPIELLATSWRYEDAYASLHDTFSRHRTVIHALVGLSDTVALAAGDAARALGLLGPQSVLVGINGDPLALAAIAEGHMHATIDTSAAELGRQAIGLAFGAARGEPLPAHFHCQPRLVTAAEATSVAAQKLVAIAGLPNRLVGVNRQQEQRRISQLEISMEINRQARLLHERQQLAHVVANLFQRTFGFTAVQLLGWRAAEQVFVPFAPAGPQHDLPLAEAGPLGAALHLNAPLFIADTQRSYRVAPDAAWPRSRARLIVPIRVSAQLIGMLDMHHDQPTQYSRQEIVGFQALADQIGIALRNAELYTEAVAARAAAERADQIKTRLLANVSHELRTPLNLIIGYTQMALAQPNPYDLELPAMLRGDLRHVYQAGEHLLRLINDLLDLSAAEIAQLTLFPELLAAGPFLENVFRSIAELAEPGSPVVWRLELEDALPLIAIDPLRLRQVLLNLLSNAQAFTRTGQITLGAAVAFPNLHIWVQDTGDGIPLAMQERIFEPFTMGEPGVQRRGGVGLGLAIVHHLIALHGGTVTLTSQPGQGSTFHISLPLPTLAAQATPPTVPRLPRLLLLGSSAPPPAVARCCALQGWAVQPVLDTVALAAALRDGSPAAVAWATAPVSAATEALIAVLTGAPAAAHVPLLLFDQTVGQVGAPMGLTNVLTKPVAAAPLAHAADALRDAADSVAPILIVDDDQQTCAFYQAILARALPTHPLRIANDGAAALASIAAHAPLPGLVILDLVMPGVDGFAVLRALRTNPQTRHIPVIVLSGKALSADEIRQLDHSRVTLHTKTVLRDDELDAQIQRALAGSGQNAQQTSALVRQAFAYIHQHYAAPLTRQAIAHAVGVSPYYLSHIFQQEIGLSPWEYIQRYRVASAKTLLQTTDASVTQIATQVGFDDASYFSRIFRKHVGVSPQTFRERPASPQTNAQ